MPWVRIDDEFVQHPKVVQVGPLGVALQVAALCYANRNLTDGFIPYGAVRLLLDFNRVGENIGDKVEFWSEVGAFNIAERLVDVGMWSEVDGGYQIHDYHDYQPSKAEAIADHQAKVAGGKARAAGAERVGGKFIKQQVNTSTTSRPSSRTTSRPPGPHQQNHQPVPVPLNLNHGVASEGDTRDTAEGVVTLVEFDAQKRAPTRPTGVNPDDVRLVFDTWRKAAGKPRAKCDPKRTTRIVQALKTYPLDDVLDAVQGWRNSPHHCGANDRGTVYNELELLLRDAAHIEQFRDLARDGPAIPLGKRTRELVNHQQGMRAIGIAKGVSSNGHDLGAVGTDRRPDQRELARPADRTLDSG